jgi:hypothetical protein
MKVLLVLVLFCLTACSSEVKLNEPKPLIEKEEMTKIMGEVALLESYFQHKFGIPSSYKEALNISVDRVLKKHGVTSKNYEDNFRFYASQYEVFSEMNKTIIEQQNKNLLNY